MTPDQFKKWRKHLGWSQSEVAEKLGLKLRMIQYYEKGFRKGKSVKIPVAVEMACYVLAKGIERIDFTAPKGRPKRKKRKKK
ncbi:MAG: XRE family transcriptional regulator [Rhizobiales bacterium TMED83]|jgi:transcriptional regulator with XRE-family HTH domain|nr:transcriptional regulator [Rhodobiaceae bacterium]RPF93109.1 MAG: XRE family transcriptional regulator [Rhizobiales bacterium TMED83]HCD17183.1 XRE family transcriptional regulator [Rhodobiaceae bacterium]|tara:strand:- start:135 stop:380 length:246 start_codon:yes stop_codon:yes gene_type:complete